MGDRGQLYTTYRALRARSALKAEHLYRLMQGTETRTSLH